MDKILLNALNNLSDSLEQIAAALKKSKNGPNSSTGSALTKGDFGGQLKEISIEIKSVKKDTQEILKHQKTILEMSKKKDKKTGVFEEAGGEHWQLVESLNNSPEYVALLEDLVKNS